MKKRIITMLLLAVSMTVLLGQTFGGGTGTEEYPYLIGTVGHLAELAREINYDNNDYSGKYFKQIADIDLDVPPYNGGQGWNPIGDGSSHNDNTGFTATYDGDGHTIANLFINRPSSNLQGLFGTTRGLGRIINLGVTDVSVTGANMVGGLLGYKGGHVRSSFATGTVTGTSKVGGLIGMTTPSGGLIFNCYANVTVTGIDYVGGLVGSNWGDLTDCYASGDVSGIILVGGLTGENYEGAFRNCQFSGTVTGTEDYVGGLIGSHKSGVIAFCSASGDVKGHDRVGGLLGDNEGTVVASHSSGTVTGNSRVGGLIGSSTGDNIIIVSSSYSSADVSGIEYCGGFIGTSRGGVTNCYATGSVSGESFLGGLMGHNGFDISNNFSTGSVTGSGESIGGLLGIGSHAHSCFWDIETSGQETSSDGVGKTTEEMKTLSTFTDSGWDFSDIWQLNEAINDGYPSLAWQEVPSSVNEETIAAANEAFVLHPAYPNPFNPSTTISFELKAQAFVTIDIFNVRGQKVKTLVDRYLSAGKHSVLWNGRDDSENTALSGVYFYKMQADNDVQINKMIMIK